MDDGGEAGQPAPPGDLSVGGTRAYVAFTPYHLLLTLAIQYRDASPPATMLLSDDAGLLDRAPGLLAALPPELSVSLLDSLDGISPWMMPSRRFASSRQVRDALRGREPAELFVFNGLTAQAFAAVRASRGAMLNGVEDGLDSYLRARSFTVPRWRSATFRLLFRQRHPHAQDITTALPYHTYHLLLPSIARVPAGSRLREIPAPCLRRAADRLGAALPSLSLGAPITHLRLLNHSDVYRDLDQVRCELVAWVDRVSRSRGSRPAVKAHPRERDGSVHTMLEGLGVPVVPHWYPAEVMGGSLVPDVRVWCGLTTFAMTSRMLIPERSVILDDTVAREQAAILRKWDPTIQRDAPVAPSASAPGRRPR